MPEPDAPAGGRRQRVEATVAGRVQGVGFRRYVQRWARQLGLVGWVKNEPDGTVRLAAEGPPEALDQLVGRLWDGPSGAAVAGVEAERSDAGPSAGTGRQPGAEFEIRR